MLNRIKKFTALALVTMMLAPGAAFAHSHRSHHHHHHHHHHRDRVHTDVRTRNAFILGGILAAVITAQAKDREHDGINDKSDVKRK